MNKRPEERKQSEDNYFEKKPLNMKSSFIGLFFLALAAVLIMIRRDGIRFFKGAETTPQGIVKESGLLLLEDVNDNLLQLLAEMGENGKKGSSYFSKTLVLDKGDKKEDAYTFRYMKNGDLSISNPGGFVFELGNCAQNFDLTAINGSGAVKTKALKKLLVKYETIFLEAIADSNPTLEASVSNVISEITLYERKVSLELDAEKIGMAIDAVISAAKEDKSARKAFEALYTGNGTFGSWLDETAMTVKGRIKELTGLSLQLYVDGKGNITMVTADAGILKGGTEHRLTGRAGYAGVVDKVEYIVEVNYDNDELFMLTGSGTVASKEKSITGDGRLYAFGEKANYYLTDFGVLDNQFILFGKLVLEKENEKGGRDVARLLFTHANRVQSGELKSVIDGVEQEKVIFEIK